MFEEYNAKSNQAIMLGSIVWFETSKSGRPELSTHLESSVHKDIVTRLLDYFEVPYDIRTSSVVCNDEMLSVSAEGISKIHKLNPHIHPMLEGNAERKKMERSMRTENAEEFMRWVVPDRNDRGIEPQNRFTLSHNDDEKITQLKESFKVLGLDYFHVQNGDNDIFLVDGADADNRLTQAVNAATQREVRRNAASHAAPVKTL